MKIRWSIFRKYDWLMVGAVCLLTAFGLLMLYSAGLGTDLAHFKKQAVFWGVGLAAMAIFAAIDYRIFRNYTLITVLSYLLVLVLLGLVLFFGRKVRGTAGWFNLGQINFEPVELAKLVLVLLLAKYFSLKHAHIYQIRHIAASAVYFLLMAGLVLLQPDLGSVLILAAIWLGLVLVSGMKIRHLGMVLLIGILVFASAWSVGLKNYQKQRVLSFLNPYRDPLGYGYNQVQSLIAIGSAGFFGKGLGQGSQVQLDFLPEKETDFIFAALSEELGWLGGFFVLLLYGLLAWRIYRLALRADNNFAKLFCAGILIMLFSTIFINAGMNLGVMPIAGIPLPFLSYGGSSLLMSFVGLGILQSIYQRT